MWGKFNHHFKKFILERNLTITGFKFSLVHYDLGKIAMYVDLKTSNFSCFKEQNSLLHIDENMAIVSK